jgi:hypothetical protein
MARGGRKITMDDTNHTDRTARTMMKGGLFPYGRSNLLPYFSGPPTGQPFGLPIPPA